MAGWQMILGAAVVAFVVVCVMKLVIPRVHTIHETAPTANSVDTAPGWVVRCRRCQGWRPAAEIGIVRLGAAGDKSFLAFCTQCRRLRMIRLERPSTSPDGHRRIIDARTNHEIGREWSDAAKASTRSA